MANKSIFFTRTQYTRTQPGKMFHKIWDPKKNFGRSIILSVLCVLNLVVLIYLIQCSVRYNNAYEKARAGLIQVKNLLNFNNSFWYNLNKIL